MKTRTFHPVEDARFLNSLITCYQEVFSDEPWNEWVKCPKCNQVWGKKSGINPSDPCSCGGSLVNFWDKETVQNDICAEITEQSTARIVTIGQKVTGFCWGYPITSVELEKKLGLPGLAQTITTQFGPGLLGYIDEVGVDPNLRLRGLGKDLWNQIVDILKSRGCQVIIARSRPDVKIFNWWLRTGYQIIQKYGKPDIRVVIARKIDD